MIIPEYEQRDMLICAFRYALGRTSMSVFAVTTNIKNAWPELSDGDKDLYKREILEHKEIYGNLGHDCDEELWIEIVGMDK